MNWNAVVGIFLMLALMACSFALGYYWKKP